MAEGNFFQLYLGNSDSNAQFERFGPENIMMLSLVTIWAMT